MGPGGVGAPGVTRCRDAAAPRVEQGGVSGLEKDATDASDSLHACFSRSRPPSISAYGAQCNGSVGAQRGGRVRGSTAAEGAQGCPQGNEGGGPRPRPGPAALARVPDAYCAQAARTTQDPGCPVSAWRGVPITPRRPAIVAGTRCHKRFRPPAGPDGGRRHRRGRRAAHRKVARQPSTAPRMARSRDP
jgi:hypothetical protein